MLGITLSSNYTVETCIVCGIHYAFPNEFYNQRRNDHKDFYCPNGHAQHYSVESDKERLRREKEQLKNQLDQEEKRTQYWRDEFEGEKRSKAAYKAHHTILKNKIKKGECPCCNRSFPDVAEHIKSVHPDYNKKMKIKKH